MIKFEVMEEKHIQGLLKVEKECFDSGFALETFNKELKNPLAYYVVAVEGEAVLGYCGIWNVCGEAEVIDIGVLSEYRKRGIGKGLFDAVFQYMRENGVGVLNLEVREDNIPAIRLYEKLGFEKVGIRKKYYDNKVDAILMKKDRFC